MVSILSLVSIFSRDSAASFLMFSSLSFKVFTSISFLLSIAYSYQISLKVARFLLILSVNRVSKKCPGNVRGLLFRKTCANFWVYEKGQGASYYRRHCAGGLFQGRYKGDSGKEWCPWLGQEQAWRNSGGCIGGRGGAGEE